MACLMMIGWEDSAQWRRASRSALDISLVVDLALHRSKYRSAFLASPPEMCRSLANKGICKKVERVISLACTR